MVGFIFPSYCEALRMLNEPNGQRLIETFLDALHLRHLDQCQSHLRAVETLAHEQPLFQPWCSYLKGILAFEADRNWSKAEQAFTTLLQTRLEPELHGRVLYALGRTFDIQGRWDEAIATFEKIVGFGQTVEKAKAWKHIAISYRNGFAQGDFGEQALQQAIMHCQLALDALETIPDPQPDVLWLKGSVWNTLGAINMNLGAWDQAITSYQHDMAICQILDDRYGIGILYLNLGEIYHRLDPASWPEAYTSYQQALSIFREFNDHYLEADTLANLAFLHQEMGEVEAALDRYSQAIEVIEALRAGVSAEEGRAGFFATVADTYANAVLLCVRAGRIAQAFDYVERARSRAFLDTLAAGSPDLPGRVEAATLLLPEVQASLPADTLLLEYFTAGLVEAREGRMAPGVQRHRFPPETTLVFAITREIAQVYNLGISPNSLRPSRLDNAVEQHFLHPNIRRALYDRLITPVEPLLHGRLQLYLVPHGPLHYIPFQALLDPDGSALLRADGSRLVYGPSATVLFRPRRSAPSPATEPCLALGYNGGGANQLRFAEEEARGVARLTGGHALDGLAPKKHVLFARAASYRLLHLSCHGRFDPERPLNSALHLAPSEDLTAAEVLERLNLRCDLVVLSACESGLNRVRRGDELIGLVRAFMFAGAPAILCTLWRVDERSTRLLMDYFYREAQAGVGFAEALKRAQLYLMRLTRQEAFDALVRLLVADLLGPPVAPLEDAHAPSLMLALEAGHAYLKGLPKQDSSTEDPPGDPEDLIFADPYYWAPFVLIGDHSSG
jgi:CHAT domain-containing protein/tetratricopeptide (TPR) repeat protein